MQEYEELVPMFQRMLELSKILRARRKQRGSIDFDFPETKMILDENGHPIDIKPYDRNVARVRIFSSSGASCTLYTKGISCQ